VAVPAGLGLGLACGLGYGLTATPQYAATAYVMVVPQHAGDSATALGFAQAYGRIVTSTAVLAGAQPSTGRPPADLRAHVQAATSPDAPMISVTGSAASGTAAARIANGVAESLTAAGNRTAGSTAVRLLVFSPALAPAAPSSPSTVLSGAVGASAGGLLGALVLLVRPKQERQEPGEPRAASADGPAAPHTHLPAAAPAPAPVPAPAPAPAQAAATAPEPSPGSPSRKAAR
jgi:capsular polysaccharide biosynthesis protein